MKEKYKYGKIYRVSIKRGINIWKSNSIKKMQTIKIVDDVEGLLIDNHPQVLFPVHMDKKNILFTEAYGVNDNYSLRKKLFNKEELNVIKRLIAKRIYHKIIGLI